MNWFVSLNPNWPFEPSGAMHSHLQFFIFGFQPISSQHAKGLWSFSFFCPMWKGAIPLLTFLCLLGGGQTTDWQHGGQMLSTCRDGRIGGKCFRSQMWKYIYSVHPSLTNSKTSKIHILGGCPGSVDHAMQCVKGEGWSSIPWCMGLIARVKLLNV